MDRVFAPVDHVAYFAQSRPRKTACVDLDRGRSFTYPELDAHVWRMCALLEHLLDGRIEGARIASLARNSADLLSLYLACLRTGAIYVPLNWRLTGPELANLAVTLEPQVLIYDREFEPAVSAIAAVTPALRVVEARVELSAALQAMEAVRRPRPRTADAVTTLLCTSGTTGAPKAVMVTEANGAATAVNYATAAEVGSRSVLLCDMPMFHVVGLFAVSRTAMQHGATLLIGERFDAEETTRRITDRALGVTHYFCAPQMAHMMRAAKAFDPAAFARLTALQTGGAPHSAREVRAWLDDGVPMVDGFGMSEAGTILGMPPGDLALLREKAGAAGQPGVNVEVRLVSRDGEDVADGETGEIWVRGPSVTPGYFRNEAATRASFQDGWLKSGDAARRDADGFYTIVDRWKDMYVSGGENVYPAEVEAALAACPGVREAAIVGVADARWGETGIAFIVASGAEAPASADIIAYCRGRLAAYKAPKHVVFVEALPRTASGKVQKAVLRARWDESVKGQAS